MKINILSFSPYFRNLKLDTLEDIFYHDSRRKQAEAKNAIKEERRPQTTAAQEEIQIEESGEENTLILKREESSKAQSFKET